MNTTSQMLAHDLPIVSVETIRDELYDHLETHYNKMDCLYDTFTSCDVVEGEHQSIMDTITGFVGHQEPTIEGIVENVVDDIISSVIEVVATKAPSPKAIPESIPVLSIEEGIAQININKETDYKNLYNELLWKHEESTMKIETMERTIQSYNDKEEEEPIMKPTMVSIGTQWEKPETDREMAIRMYNEEMKKLQDKYGIKKPITTTHIIPDTDEHKGDDGENDPIIKPTKVKGKGKKLTTIDGTNCGCWIWKVMKPDRSYSRKDVIELLRNDKEALQSRNGKPYSKNSIDDYFTRLLNGGFINRLGGNRYSKMNIEDGKKNDPQ